MTVFHVIHNISKINYGVWKVVLDSITYNKNLQSYMIVLNTPDSIMDELKQLKLKEKLIFKSRKESFDYLSDFTESETLIVTHGCWTSASWLGWKLSKLGFKWVAYPHGMLEPWAIKNNYWKKKLYFSIIEKRILNKSDTIVAVGLPEFENLTNLFPSNNCIHIPNGIVKAQPCTKDTKKIIFTFMARLHYKKGVVELIKAWCSSDVLNNSQYLLNIVGPDEGELEKIEALSQSTPNIKIYGARYGKEKKNLLDKSHFFVLPSYSEGFPTSIVEAMSFGCIPIISKGCNFPEIENYDFSVVTDTDVGSIQSSLEYAVSLNSSKLEVLSAKAKKFVDANYDIRKVVDQQNVLFKNLMLPNG